MIELLKKYFERYFVIKCTLLFGIFIISINILLKLSNVIEIYSLNRLANENTKKYLTYMSNNPEELIVNEELIYNTENNNEIEHQKASPGDPSKLKVDNGHLLYSYRVDQNKIVYTGKRILQEGTSLGDIILFDKPENLFILINHGWNKTNIKINEKIIETELDHALNFVFNKKTKDCIYYKHKLARKGIYYLNGEKKELGRPFDKIYMSPNGKYIAFKSTEGNFDSKLETVLVYKGDNLVFKDTSSIRSHRDVVFFNEVDDDYYCLIDKNKIYKNGELYIDYSDLLGEYGRITKVKILNNGKVGIVYDYYERNSENKVVNSEYGVKVDNKLIFKSRSEIVNAEFTKNGDYVYIKETNMLIPFIHVDYNFYINDEFLFKSDSKYPKLVTNLKGDKYAEVKKSKIFNRYMTYIIDEPIDNLNIEDYNFHYMALDTTGHNLATIIYERDNPDTQTGPTKVGINFSISEEKYDRVYKTVYYPKERCFASIAVRDNKIYLVKYWVPSMKKLK